MCQCVTIHSQRFNAFTYINKFAGKRQGNPIGITYADMTSSRQAGMATWRHDVTSQAGERGKASGNTGSAADFWERKKP